jgi:hypothetical protein
MLLADFAGPWFRLDRHIDGDRLGANFVGLFEDVRPFGQLDTLSLRAPSETGTVPIFVPRNHREGTVLAAMMIGGTTLGTSLFQRLGGLFMARTGWLVPARRPQPAGFSPKSRSLRHV